MKMEINLEDIGIKGKRMEREFINFMMMVSMKENGFLIILSISLKEK